MIHRLFGRFATGYDEGDSPSFAEAAPMNFKLFVTLVLVACVSTGMLPKHARAGDNAWVEDASRPKTSSRILATTGTVLGYHLIASHALVSERLTIWDELTRKKQIFVLTSHTELNGKRMKCSWPPTVPPSSEIEIASELHFCRTLPPRIVIGHTRVVLVYWNRVQKNSTPLGQLASLYPFTDAIWTIQ